MLLVGGAESQAGRARAIAPARSDGRLTDLLALALYVLLAVAFTWPLPMVINSAIMGNGADGWQETWEMWWMDRAIHTGSPPYHFATLYAPDGETNYLHSLNPIIILLTMPAQWAFGPLAAYNLACWMALSLTAFAGYLLGRDVTGNRGAGLVAGLALGFAPHQFAQLLGHLDVASIQFFVLSVWCLYRSFHAAGRCALAWSLWSAACVAASGLSHPYALISALIVLPFMGLYLSFQRREGVPRWQPIANTATALAVGLLPICPLLLAMAHQLAGLDAPRRRDIPAEIRAEREEYSADLLAYAVPSPFHPLWGEAATSALTPVAGGLSEKVVHPGYTVLALGLLGAVAPLTRRKALLWWLLALVGFVLSLGPTLRIAGSSTGIPMPGELFYLLPGTFMVRVPARFNVIFLLGLSMCAALGLCVLWKRIAAMKWRYAAFGVAALLIGLEFLPAPYPISRFEVEPWFEEVDTSAGGPNAVLEVPFHAGDSRPLMWQIASGLPIAGGYLSRQPVEPLSGGVPPFTEFGLNAHSHPASFDRSKHTLCRPTPDQADYLNVMRLAGLRFLVLHRNLLDSNDPRIGLAEELFPTSPIYQSEALTVYDTGGGEAPSSLFGLVEDIQDWFPIEEGRGRWAFSRPARLHFWSGAERDMALELTLASFPYERDVAIFANGQQLDARRVTSDGHNFKLRWRASKGFGTVTILADGPAVSPASLGIGSDTRPLTVLMSDCRYSVEDMP